MMCGFISLLRKGNQKVSVPDNFSEERYMTAYPDCKGKAKRHYQKEGAKQKRIMYVKDDMGNPKMLPTVETPLVSVVMTSYNYEKYISAALESVLAQTYTNFEIIVIDDGSKDSSIDIIKAYSEEHPSIRLYMHKGRQNKGLPASMRLGIDKAKGEYVAFCESDDLWAPNHLEEKIKIINAYKDVFIVSNAINMFGNVEDMKARSWVCQYIRKLLKQGGTPIDLRYNQSFNFIPTLSSVMIKRNLLLSLDYNTPVPAWIDFWLYRQILINHILYFVDEDLTFWRQHDSFNSLENSAKIADCLPSFLQKSNQLIGL